MASAELPRWFFPRPSTAFRMMEAVSAGVALIPHLPPIWADVFGEDDFGVFAECEVNHARFVWRWICAGVFLMGSPNSEKGRMEREGPRHEVRITRGFWMAETPVTQAQWEAVMRENPSHFRGPARPVGRVSWNDGVAFAARLNARVVGLHAALPTEAQWEYACRAGTQGAFHDDSPCTRPTGKDPALDRLGWFDKNSRGEINDVKTKAPNAWGLYDMHGNVWEWCRDAWDEAAYAKRQPGAEDPLATGADRAHRVVRGGSWDSLALVCRAACRGGVEPGDRSGPLGLRLSAGHELQPRGGGAAVGAERPAGEAEPCPEGRRQS